MKIVSFFIITYNRPNDAINAINNILFFLEKPNNTSIEIVIVNNNSTVDYIQFKNYVEKLKKDHQILYIKNNENLGVAGGRNIAMENCSGEILISIDDDAIFMQKDTIFQILDLFKKYEHHNVKALTFVEKRINGEIFIASKSPQKNNKQELFTSFFVGCGHAFTKDIITKLGGYSKLEKYGAEEYDISYKMLAQGYRIVHTNNISVLHKKSKIGRANIKNESADSLKNKSLIAFKYLPKKFFYSHLFWWSLFYLVKSNGNIFKLLSVLKTTIKESKNIERTPISEETINYIKKIGGRISY